MSAPKWDGLILARNGALEHKRSGPILFGFDLSTSPISIILIFIKLYFQFEVLFSNRIQSMDYNKDFH